MREPSKTRQRILEAAQRCFSKKSFDATGVREIAADAGVNIALLNRYFGSKERLFEEAVAKAIQIDDLLVEDKSTFGARTAGAMLINDFVGVALDPTRAFVNSLGSPVVGERLRASISDRLLPRIASWIDGEHAEQRAALIFSTLLGFDILRRMAKLAALDPEHRDTIEKMCAATLQKYVDG